DDGLYMKIRMTKSEIILRRLAAETKVSVDRSGAWQHEPRTTGMAFRYTDFGFLSGFGLRISGLVCLLALLLASAVPAAPLRVFIRAGVKTHGPNQHDHPRFLEDWKKLLTERGVNVDGALDFPSAAHLESTDVLVIYSQDGMKIIGEQRASLEKFLQRGGGLVVIH